MRASAGLSVLYTMPYVSGETLATSLSLNGAGGAAAAQIEGRELLIAVQPA